MIEDSENGILKTLESPMETAQKIMVILDGTSIYGARVALKIAEEMLEFRRLTDGDREFEERTDEMVRRQQAAKDKLDELRDRIVALDPKKLQ